jgi:hypothetical protein
MPAVPHAADAFVVASVDAPRNLVLTVRDGHGANAVAWEHWLEPIDSGRTRLIVRGRASSHWLDLARAPTPTGHHRIFIERAYAARLVNLVALMSHYSAIAVLLDTCDQHLLGGRHRCYRFLSDEHQCASVVRSLTAHAADGCRDHEPPRLMRGVGRTRLSGHEASKMHKLLRHSLETGPVTWIGVILRFALAFVLLIVASTLVAAAQAQEGQIGGVVLDIAAQTLAEPREGAQPAVSQTAEELGGKVNVGDTIFVTDRNGGQTGGRLLRLSAEGLALLVGGQERVIPRNSIGRVEKRDSLWNGMLIGAVPSALIGMAAAGASCSPHCGRDVPLGGLVLGAIGAGVGALVDASIRGYSIVDGPPLASPNVRSVPLPVTVIADLWLRVRQGDTIDVVTLSEQKVTGKFVQASSAFVALMVDGRRREIPSSDVRRVTRAGNRYRSGALWSGAIFGAIGLFSSAGCSGGGCGNALFVAMFTGTAGALWGAAIGAAIPKHLVVYDAGTSSAVRVMPMIGRHRVGMEFSTAF